MGQVWSGSHGGVRLTPGLPASAQGPGVGPTARSSLSQASPQTPQRPGWVCAEPELPLAHPSQDQNSCPRAALLLLRPQAPLTLSLFLLCCFLLRWFSVAGAWGGPQRGREGNGGAGAWPPLAPGWPAEETEGRRGGEEWPGSRHRALEPREMALVCRGRQGLRFSGKEKGEPQEC